MNRPAFSRISAVILAAAIVSGVPAVLHASPSSAPNPYSVIPVRSDLHVFPPLSPAQVNSLAANANQRVIVILKNQFKSKMGGARSALSARSAAIAASQATVLSELRRVRAGHVHSFTIINAIKATVSDKEQARLRADPEVRSVVPDATIKAPRVERPVATAAVTRAVQRRVRRSTNCSNTTPVLAPEALALTNTAFDNSGTPQAQNIATGAGVKVAFMADGIDPQNADLKRMNGSAVISDFKDFTGDGLFAQTGGAEAFGDASSIAAQGKKSYLINNYLIHPIPAGCHNIRILGVAPGVSMTVLKVFGSNGGSTSNFVEAIQYAVKHGVNVLNQSFGGDPFPDNADDPIALADAAAVTDGVTLTVSSGDGGTANNISSPSTVPGVISVGATTQFLGYKQTNAFGYQLSNGDYASNNISAISSAGIAQSGLKTPDVVAPGDLGWALCSTDINTYQDCQKYVKPNHAAQPTAFQLFGGTSESSPLVAGEAALVIQAYKTSHSGQKPSASVVKDIIMSTATNLGQPSYEQGAGLMNSLKAVQAAQAFGKSGSQPGNAVLTSGHSEVAFGTAGTTATFKITATNNGSAAKVIRPKIQKLGRPTSNHSFSVPLKQSSDPTFTDEVGVVRSYATKTFTVPSGADRLDASISWNVIKKPFSLVRLTLLDPNRAFTAYTLPQDFGYPLVTSGYGHVDVASPMAGTWKAVIWTKKSSAQTGYTGAVQLSEFTSNWVGAGSVSPAQKTVAPSDTATFTVKTTVPGQVGDRNENINFGPAAGAIPVILRSIVPTSSHGGHFAGTLTGTNGRLGAAETMTYQFRVPNNVPLLGLGITIPGNGYNLQATLLDPNGLPVDTQSNITKLKCYNYNSGCVRLPSAFRKTLQLMWKDPQPGNWRLVFILDNNISGATTSTKFAGRITFSNQPVTGSGVPNSSSVTVKKGTKRQVSLTIHNTGNSPEQFFVDPRLTAKVLLGENMNQSQGLAFLPPQSTLAVFGAEHVGSNVPIHMDCLDDNGSGPAGALGSPDIAGTQGTDSKNGRHDVIVKLSTGGQIPHGFWTCSPSQIGPFAGTPDHSFNVACVIKTQAFDTGVHSSTGDVIEAVLGITNQQPSFLTIPPGGSKTLHLTISPSSKAKKGSIVKGNLYVDSMATIGHIFTTGSEDQVAAIPYKYKVG